MFSEYATALSQFRIGDMYLEYIQPIAGQTGQTAGQTVGLRILPAALLDRVAVRRADLQTHEIRLLPDFMKPVRAWHVEPLVQIKLAGDSTRGFSQGVTMRNSDTLSSLHYVGQEVCSSPTAQAFEIVTTLRSDRGFACDHHLYYEPGYTAFSVQTVLRNEGQKPLTLELLASFSLSGLSPFAVDDSPNRLYIHRFRSAWSAEGRHVCQSVEELNLERSWSGHGVRCERFGQVGSMPVRGYFPFIAVEDRAEGVLWGAQLAWAGSWQMEAYRRDDQLTISGGLADRELGHWTKTVMPGESLASPVAYMSTVHGDLDDLCQRLTTLQIPAAEQAPASEQPLPVLFNEWCATWGNPDHARIADMARSLKDTGVKYFVIDAGWYQTDGSDGSDGTGTNSSNWENGQGDWNPSARLFPQGIAAAAAAIRDQGLIPGLWFEFEVVGSQATLFARAADHFLRRDGLPITAGQRRFWDFRDPWVRRYLREKVIDLLREAGFGYIKVDYNETIGIGADGTEAPGEVLRQHLLAVQEFFREMRQACPDLVIEVCSAGGHRLEPSMLGLASMGSFSDAHESLEIPIIAANLHRLILPRQSQIWAVLHAADSMQRLAYSLSAGFLGRLCLSGEIERLDAAQWALLQQAINFYGEVAPIIRQGQSRLYQHIGTAWRHPRGTQAVLRTAHDGSQALLVVHSFAAPLPDEIVVPLPGGDWRIAGTFPDKPAIATTIDLDAHQIKLCPSEPFEGFVVHLTT